MAEKNILTNETKDVSLLRKSFKCAGLRKLTIAQSKGDVICFEIDVITLVVPVVLCLKNTFH